jgi:hypothetical protein
MTLRRPSGSFPSKSSNFSRTIANFLATGNGELPGFVVIIRYYIDYFTFIRKVCPVDVPVLTSRRHIRATHSEILDEALVETFSNDPSSMFVLSARLLYVNC